MKDYGTEKLRNLALLSHCSAGKTSLAEAMLFNTGATTRLGKVEEGRPYPITTRRRYNEGYRLALPSSLANGTAIK